VATGVVVASKADSNPFAESYVEDSLGQAGSGIITANTAYKPAVEDSSVAGSVGAFCQVPALF